MTRPPLPPEVSLATRLSPGPDWAGGHVEEGGDDHLVLVPGDAAPTQVLRIARRPEVAALLPTRMALLSAIAPHLPWDTPEPLSEVSAAVDGEWAPEGEPEPVGVVQRFISGGAHAPHEGDPATLRGIVEAIAAVPRHAWDGLVTGPFVSSAAWDEAGREAVLAALPHEEHAAAQAVWEGLEAIEGEAVGLTHGDLAGHNLRWRGPQLLGVIDWDHAAAWDPARNLAHLALWHGTDIISPAAPEPRWGARAALWVGHEALYRVRRAAEDGGIKRWDRLLRKTLPRVGFAARAGAGVVLG